MLEIENTTVVDGNVVGDNLILVTREGTQIDAGSVRGPQGIPGPPIRHVIQEETASLPDRSTLRFVGQGVTATDDAANDRTLVTIPTAGHVIYDETLARTQRAGLSFMGNRVSVADDAANNRSNVSLTDSIMAYQGSWSATVYQNRDVVARWGGYWIWASTTPSTAVQEPGVGSNSWTLIGGCPVMTSIQIDAWTSIANGSQVWDLNLNTLFVYENGWIPAVPSVWSGTAVGAQFTGVSSGNTVGAIAVPPAPYARQALATVVMRVDNDSSGTGVLGIRIESGSVLGQARTPPMTANQADVYLTAIGAITIPANSSYNIQWVFYRISGNLTGKCWADGTVNRLNVVAVPI